MTDDHVLQVLTEPPVIGREENARAWTGYTSSFPDYVIYPHRITERDGRVAVLGRTTGSHLRLPDAEELRLTAIWLAEVRHGQLSRWQILEDTRENRSAAGLA